MKLATILFVLCGWVSIASAQPGYGPPAPPPNNGGYATQPGMYGYADPGAHRHDGFYLRMFLGFGYTQMKLEDADFEVAGTGGGFGLALGGAVSENLIVFGELFDDIAVNPTVKMGGVEQETNNISAGTVGVGAGLAYYFMPTNMYLSGALTYTRLTVQEDGVERGKSDFGPGVSLIIGKEWWVSNNWGVGLAAQFFAGRMKDSEDSGAPTWQTTAFAIGLSATYN